MVECSGNQKTFNPNVSAANVFYFLLIPTLTLWYMYWHLSRRHMLKLAKNIPGPKSYPLIGNALDLIGSPTDIFRTVYNYSFQYGIVPLWIGPKLVIFITDPKDVEVILHSYSHIDKASEYKFLRPWLGNSILISTGYAWRTHKKLIAPTLYLNFVKGFVDRFNAISRETVDKLLEQCGNTFDCHDYMSDAVIEMLFETVMGVSKKTKNKSGHEYTVAAIKMCEIIHFRHTKFWLRPDWIFNLTKYGKMQKTLLNTIHSFTRNVLKSKKDALSKDIQGFPTQRPREIRTENRGKLEIKEPTTFRIDDKGERKRMAVLDLMIEASQNGNTISDEQVKEEVDTLMFAAHDTTTAASSFFLCLMGAHQEIQARVHEELDTIFGNSDRPATFADTLEMKYLERCLLETLRLYPPVPIFAREIKQDVKLVSGDYTIPAGCTVVIGTFKLHRRPDIYQNPDVYDPDNFLPERKAGRHYYSFIPFSAGPRSCVGRRYAMVELKILLSTIMRNFVVKSDVSESDFRLEASIILKREDGYKIRLEPRHIN